MLFVRKGNKANAKLIIYFYNKYTIQTQWDQSQ